MFLDRQNRLCYRAQLLRMNIHRSYRRSVLKLIARLRMLSKRSAFQASNVATLAVLATVIVTAWLVIAFSRVSVASSSESHTVEPIPVRAPVQATPVSQSWSANSTVLAKREVLVYILDGDSTYFHSPMHVHDSDRQAVPLAVAKTRGLVPCPVCFRTKNRLGAVANR